jgi:acyl-coenzyme A thioesterase PaaI-like protein
MTQAKKRQTNKPIQAFYPEPEAICYGCGPYNHRGLRINTYWDGKEGVCQFYPETDHTGYPGFVYGGLIASLIDCHSVGTAIAAAYDAEEREPGTKPAITFVTGTLTVRYLRPTPMDVPITLKAQVKSQWAKKTVIYCVLLAEERKCAEGEVIAIRAPWGKNSP